MASVQHVRSGAKNSGHRTNSLGYAKIDCHTCAASKEPCDRQRPWCGTCIAAGQKCGGFAMDLVWKGLAVADNATQSSPSSGSSVDRKRQRQSSKEHHEFKFIQGRPKRKRKPKNSDQQTMIGSLRPFHLSDQVDVVVAAAPQTVVNPIISEPGSSSGGSVYGDLTELNDGPFIHENALGSRLPHLMSFESNPDITVEMPQPAYDTTSDNFWHDSPESNTLLPQNLSSPSLNDARFLEDLVAEGLQLVTGGSNFAQSRLISEGFTFPNEENTDEVTYEEQFPLAVGVPYRDLAHKYSPVLAMYDEDFCVMPLSRDCSTNPFRICINRSQSSAFLLHAILALSSQHLAKKNDCAALMTEMHNHRSSAIQLFSQALGNTQSKFRPLLDTVLILINLEITQSARGMWGVHLNGARRLLEQAGPVEKCQGNSRIRAQLAMLVWWDVTIAFIARKEPRLPIAYLETLMEYDETDGWTYFILNGCPPELVMAMARLAKLAGIYEKTTRMEWTMFNHAPVDAIVEEVKNFVNDADVDLDDLEHMEEDADTRRNRFHCIEAWRHAILLHVCRVFTPKQDAFGLRLISHLSRVVLDHVRCIPATEVIQKQVLLPIFLAASEAGDEHSRSFARQYCEHWNIASRTSHFQATAELLEDIWKDWRHSTRDVYWWGLKTGGQVWPQTGSGEDQSMVSELLLG